MSLVYNRAVKSLIECNGVTAYGAGYIRVVGTGSGDGMYCYVAVCAMCSDDNTCRYCNCTCCCIVWCLYVIALCKSFKYDTVVVGNHTEKAVEFAFGVIINSNKTFTDNTFRGIGSSLNFCLGSRQLFYPPHFWLNLF